MLALFVTLSALATAPSADAGVSFGWQYSSTSRDTVVTRFAPPEGFHRVEFPESAFARWLRALPLLPENPSVLLHTGALKGNQKAHLAVVDIDVGTKDLQQCADAVMRLWAEFQWSNGAAASLCIPATNGDSMPWSRWRAGERPVVAKKIGWKPKSAALARDDHDSFRSYLDFVFTYAGTASMGQRMAKKPSGSVEPGDVFLQPGSPGHVVLVIDVVENAQGERRFALLQSYMPAQQMHVLDSPSAPGSIWYPFKPDEALKTPEWDFPADAWRRLPMTSDTCAK